MGRVLYIWGMSKESNDLAKRLLNMDSFTIQQMAMCRPIPRYLKEKEEFEAIANSCGGVPFSKEEIQGFIKEWRDIFKAFPYNCATNAPIYDTIIRGVMANKNNLEIASMLEYTIQRELSDMQIRIIYGY